MPRFALRALVVAAGLFAGLHLTSAPAMAQNCGPQCQPRYYGTRPDLFYNYYSPGMCAQATAAMYPCPHPVPPHVGYTYITYQPLMPHQFLYHHADSYHRLYDNGKGLNATRIRYR